MKKINFGHKLLKSCMYYKLLKTLEKTSVFYYWYVNIINNVFLYEDFKKYLTLNCNFLHRPHKIQSSTSPTIHINNIIKMRQLVELRKLNIQWSQLLKMSCFVLSDVCSSGQCVKFFSHLT